ncbi:hypothetical protein PHYBOEH_010554 [Phytophthora boehmeriae]|uniref:N-acetyltransferase domain-containing protein n=1 Tax=Phytophthora boehmeriae TaxID=109152 RepID=A0A8T1VLN8_9STRA|nr:hypothetical protein PHYBOEH_010554 [Phytophthora boehmeriae]
MVALEPASTVNEFGQPIGLSMGSWTPPPFPPRKTLSGVYCQVEPLESTRHAQDIWEALESTRHAQDIWEALGDDPSDARWTYLPYGPYKGFDEFGKWCSEAEQTRDPQFYAIVVDGHAVGLFAYFRVDPSNGVIEVGHVHFSPRLARTCAAAESIYLLLKNAFDLGYRRFEWKCDSFHTGSCVAAGRFGFTYEGKFRQLIVYKGRSRDTMWFSIIDSDWNGGLKEAYDRWLDSDNFDQDGQQKLKLSELTEPFVHARP